MKIKNQKISKKINFKNAGISVLIAMGTSMMVLGLAFATLNSVANSQEQATNIQRSTQLFYASESGIEAAFFHHNARKPGISFTTSNPEQIINHTSINAQNSWSIEGQSDYTTKEATTHPLFGDVLKENQTIQIPLSWDTSTLPENISNTNNAPNINTDHLKITFYQSSEHMDGIYENAEKYIEKKYGDNDITNTIGVGVPDGFDFGDDGDGDPTDGDGGATGNQVLIDWSLSRDNQDGTAGAGVGKGIQTFVPTKNEECANTTTAVSGFICEDQILAGSDGNGLTISTRNIIDGKILPGGITTTLDKFWNCTNDTGIVSYGTPPNTDCKDFRFTVRPLLKYTSTTGTKIKGIPFAMEINPSSVTTFPKHFYTIKSDVTQEDFSQQISLDVNERTSIGAFDYVIFD